MASNNDNNSWRLIILTSIATIISYADRSNIACVIVVMKEEFGWDSLTGGLVISAFFVGYGSTQCIGGYIADGFGGKKVLSFALVIWSFFTFFTPICAHTSYFLLICCRIGLGIGEGVALPAIHSLISEFEPKKRQSTAVGIVTASCYFGAFFAFFLSPILMESFGWESSFYVFGGISLLWLPLWLIYDPCNDSFDKRNICSIKRNDPYIHTHMDSNSPTNSISSTTSTAYSPKGGTHTHTHGYTPPSIDMSDENLKFCDNDASIEPIESKINKDEYNSESHIIEEEGKMTDEFNSIIVHTQRTHTLNTHTHTHIQTPTQAYTHTHTHTHTPTNVRSEDQINAHALVDKIILFIKQKEVIAIILCQYFQSWGMWGTLNWLPSFFHSHHNISPTEWIFTTAPSLIQGITGVLTGFATDYLIIKLKIRTLKVRRTLQFISCIGAALSLIVSVLPNVTPMFASTWVAVSCGVSSLCLGGVSVSQLDITPSNAGLVFGMGSTASIIAGVVAMPITGFIIDYTQSWALVFSIFASHYVLAGILFCYFAGDKRISADYL
eukprot:GHVR01086348.1.p1 GENE.GHVR01086348.1~~GHVR01086348.1.p1  ORF type:complete len:573 (+),score=160.53 GHVR01086348.1:63-1721(+)